MLQIEGEKRVVYSVNLVDVPFPFIGDMSNFDRQNNFRTNYVGRMVGDKAECSRFQIEEQILSEDADVDLAKLAQFAFKHHVPGVHRVPIWKLLLSSCFFGTYLVF